MRLGIDNYKNADKLHVISWKLVTFLELAENKCDYLVYSQICKILSKWGKLALNFQFRFFLMKEKKEIMTSAEARLEPILSSLGVKEAVVVVVVAHTRILFSCK